MNDNEQIRKALKSITGKQAAACILRVTVKEVNKEEKTFTGKSLSEEPDYEDIRCGMGSIVVYPARGCMALIVHVENRDTDSYLLDCEEIEEIIINDGKNGGLANTPELSTQLGKLTARVDGIINAINNGVPASGAADGGAGLQTSIKTLLVQITDKEDFSGIEDETVKH